MSRLRDSALTWNVVGDEVVVLDLEGSVYLHVNGSGRLLWDGLAGGCSDDDLIDLLCERYAVERRQAAVDVAAFVADARGRGLLTE